MAPSAEYSAKDVEAHNTREDAWIIVKDKDDGFIPKVYNVTDYLDDHPGGAEVVLERAGQDATDMFESIGHTQGAIDTMKQFLVGTLVLTEEDKAKMAAAAEVRAARAKNSKGGLNPLAVLVLLLAIVAGYYYSQMNA